LGLILDKCNGPNQVYYALRQGFHSNRHTSRLLDRFLACVGWDAREIIIFMIGVRERVLKNSFHAVETCLINMFHYKFRFMYAKLIPIEVQII
jgi:hypothetical protein